MFAHLWCSLTQRKPKWKAYETLAWQRRADRCKSLTRCLQGYEFKLCYVHFRAQFTKGLRSKSLLIMAMQYRSDIYTHQMSWLWLLCVQILLQTFSISYSTDKSLIKTPKQVWRRQLREFSSFVTGFWCPLTQSPNSKLGETCSRQQNADSSDAWNTHQTRPWSLWVQIQQQTF